MSDLTTQIIDLLTPLFARATRTPGGVGYVLHDGHEIKCAGLMGPNPRLVEDAAFDPPAEILIQHTLGHFVVDPDHKAQFPDAAICVGNDPLQGSFVLADGMTFDSDNPVCSVCGQPFQL